MLTNPRLYGQPPYQVAVIHGGPGAAGEMAPVARRLARSFGVLEPLQTAASLQGQVDELATLLRASASGPCTLIGYSWGAWLACLTAAQFPTLVKQLVLVSSGPFEARYAAEIHSTRLARLSPAQRADFENVLSALGSGQARNTAALMARLGELTSYTDLFDPLPEASGDPPVNLDAQLFQAVWSEASPLRASGELMQIVKRISCPVTALHGDHDPHPAEGVRAPLAAALPDFQFILLPNCGHTPWKERLARDLFYTTLENLLTA